MQGWWALGQVFLGTQSQGVRSVVQNFAKLARISIYRLRLRAHVCLLLSVLFICLSFSIIEIERALKVRQHIHSFLKEEKVLLDVIALQQLS